MRWNLIGSCPWATAPDRWGAHPCPMAGGPHILGGVFLSLLEYFGVDVQVFSLCKCDMWTSFCYYPDNPLQRQTFTKTHIILLVITIYLLSACK